MAFYSNIENPHQYVDKSENDWSVAKEPRMRRLLINNENNKKYLKVMAFRLMDLTVIYLFLENRYEKLSQEEQKNIRDSKIDYEKYSSKKKEMYKI